MDLARKRKAGSRYAIISILLTTILSSVVGGFAVIDSRNSDLEALDLEINTVIARVQTYPNEALSAAILAIEEDRLDVTLSLVTREGNETVISESQLFYGGIPSIFEMKQGLVEPITVQAQEPYRLRAIEIAGGDFLVISGSLAKLDKNFSTRLKTIALVTVLADALAIFFSIYFLRRHNRGLDAEALDRMQRFLGDASHELRTPLTVIKGYTEMLSKGQMSDVIDRARAFSRVNSEIERMESLIRDLLLLAELGESRPAAFEVLDFDELVTAHVNDFKFFNKDRSIDTEIITECNLSGSREHLNRLIQNCLSNIVRHTPPDAKVKITLKNIGKKARLIIEDGGPGLPAGGYGSEIKAMNRFDPSRSRESGGSGLGLSIIAAIVQEHEGVLELRKSELNGLAIVIELPI